MEMFGCSWNKSPGVNVVMPTAHQGFLFPAIETVQIIIPKITPKFSGKINRISNHETYHSQTVSIRKKSWKQP